MTSYNFGDVVLVPFPFTDQTGGKKRPAVVVSSAAYNAARLDLILMAVTNGWQNAGLLKPSVIKPCSPPSKDASCFDSWGTWSGPTATPYNKTYV
jgi:hypothetical protein